MRYTLFDYQSIKTNEIVKALRFAGKSLEEDSTHHWSVALSAPTGAGKTVIAAAVIESLFDGAGEFPEDPLATVLWVTDDPALNEQTKRNMVQASSTLGPNRLTTIDASFDRDSFGSRHVYFLNIQKLARTNPLVRSNVDIRRYSLWDTIGTTIRDNGSHFYVVIDEAHRGMRADRERPTIVSRIINGRSGSNPPAPIVWGISATPARFMEAIARWDLKRTVTTVNVPLEDVRASGLLKDQVVLDNPKKGQAQSDTSLVRAGVIQTLKFGANWESYTETQNEPPVIPVLVVQVHNKPTESELAELFTSVFDSWTGLCDRNVVNTFGEHTAIGAGGHTIAYMAPQDIQDDLEVRVVLCKDAISTGWDCPRAEVLVSLRSAEDYTYIAQLIGRMVRTPLARRIPTDQTLNDVHCYLPRFNRHQVEEIAKRFAAGTNDEPPIDVITDPIRVARNPLLPAQLAVSLQGLPTYVVPGRVYRTQISRLYMFATLLAGDHIVEDALAQVRLQLNGTLATERRRLEVDGSFDRDVRRVQDLRIERTHVLLAAESLDDLPVGETYSISRDDNNIEDLYRVAMRKLPEGVAINYWTSLVEAQGEGAFDPIEAKAATAVLGLHREVVEAVESVSERLVQTWLRTHQQSISKLPDSRRVAYETVKRETRTPELTDLVLPAAKVVPDGKKRWPKHLLAMENGMFPYFLKGWELKVLERELADEDLLGWYRNPTGGAASLRIPYRIGQMERPMYPDFILFHDTPDGIRPSIVDPHGFHLADAGPKLKGLAAYAARHGDQYDRIDAIVEIDGRLLALNVRSVAVREAILNDLEGDVRKIFERHGGDYQ